MYVVRNLTVYVSAQHMLVVVMYHTIVGLYCRTGMFKYIQAYVNSFLASLMVFSIADVHTFIVNGKIIMDSVWIRTARHKVVLRFQLQCHHCLGRLMRNRTTDTITYTYTERDEL